MTIERLVEVEKEVESVKEYLLPEMDRRFEEVGRKLEKMDERLEHLCMATERIVDISYEIKTILADTKRTQEQVQSHENRLDFLEKHHVEGKRGREVKDYAIKVVVSTGAVAILAAIWKILGG